MMLDIDNDGYFSREDIQRVVSEHGLFEVRPPVSRGCGLRPTSQLSAFAGQDPSKAATEAVMAREQADRAFAAIDQDGDGVITPSEFRSALTDAPEPEPEGERARARGSE